MVTMKKAHFIFSLILLVTSCQEDAEIPGLQIVGVWYQNAGIFDTPNLSYRNTIEFKSDGTFETSLQVVDTENIQNVVGYLSLTKGEYQINGKILRRFSIEQYGLDNENQFLDRGELVLEAFINELPEIGVKLDETGDILTLVFSCEEDASCVPSQTYKRSK